jgi:ABC-type multidrug transport system ATPase subunit
VRDNLTLFGTRTADDDRLLAVIDQVGLGDWLAALPDGLDTRLDGGQGLSAGEGQLVAFARAFLADPAVVVLDEASSRLDPMTEERITAATEALLAGRTAVIIAHRLDTLDRVDEIAVLDAGRIVEQGERSALARDAVSRYARLRRAAEAAGDRPGDRPGDRDGDRPGDRDGHGLGDKTGHRTGDPAGDEHGDEPGDHTGDHADGPVGSRVDAFVGARVDQPDLAEEATA